MEPLIHQYTLFAIPSLFAAGPYRGELEGITFIAQSTQRTIRWFAVNCGQFDKAFAELVSFDAARQLMNTLRSGASVHVPGTYRFEQFNTGFHPTPDCDYACLS